MTDALDRAELAAAVMIDHGQPIYDLDARAVARAVLMAVREPGLPAVEAVFEAADDLSEGGPLAVWQAGIDAILAEPQP